MKTYCLLVLKPSFVTSVQDFLNKTWELVQSIDRVKDKLTEKEFKNLMWLTLKKYWMCQRDQIPDGFEGIIPESIRESTCTIVSKQARQELKLDNGDSVPMFNYAGECVDAGQIPHILGIMGSSQTISYTADGKTPSGAKGIFDALKDINVN
jgi:hypothetical protein